MAKPTAIVYIDGLNLQRRLVDKVPGAGWLDYWQLATIVLPNFKINKVRVFTSTLATEDPTLAEARWQKQVLLQSELSIHLGRIKKTTRLYPLTASQTTSEERNSVKVLKYEEKGSDVSLAAHMVRDALLEKASIHYLMTSDTDFEPVIEMLKTDLNVRVGILCTTKNIPKLFLKLEPHDIRHVKLSQVEKALLKSLSP